MNTEVNSEEMNNLLITMNHLTTDEEPNYIKKINNMRLDSLRNRKRTVFIDHSIGSPEEINNILSKLSWKSFTKLQKIKKINEYIKINDLKFSISTDNVKNYNIKNIVFDTKIQRITNIEVSKKKL